MKTVWGERLDPDHVLAEYPRPQMVRESYLNLNGYWDYAITETETQPDRFDGKILVPFSPECELSGVMFALWPTQTLWYRRVVHLPPEFRAGRVLLHFGAVDQIATVSVNGVTVCEHVGGYTPFSADITAHVQETNVIVVKVRDFSDMGHHSRGKQKLDRGGIWYTAQSGIWQTVWMECVPEDYIMSLRLTPLFDESALEITVVSERALPCVATVGDHRIAFTANEPARLVLPSFIAWTPENPHLYDLAVEMGDDRVQSYFGMRKFSVAKDERGIRRLFLNNRPYFHNGLLDQGYYSDGMYTPASDEAMIFDIQMSKAMGFNMLRKHIKIEPLRWYYHCDRLGMLVWQDMVNGGGDYRPIIITGPAIAVIHFRDRRYSWFARTDEDGRRQYYQELREMISHLYNVVSIAVWVPFNEGWGQFNAAAAVKEIKRLDTTRTIDHASGWHDQYIGELKSLHVYFKKYRYQRDPLNRAIVLTEFGGYNHRVEGHSYTDRDYGYRRFDTPEALLDAYRQLYENQIIPAKAKGLCAAVYTQLSDVEDEVNGLVTYDRKVIKLPVEQVRQLNAQLSDAEVPHD